MLTTALLLLALQAPAPVAAQPPAAPLTPPDPVVIVDTTAGAITIQLYADKAPDSVRNFLEYVRDGFYSGTIFHRVVPGYVIQGGGYTPELVEKSTRPPVRNEATNGLANARGTVAMARMSAVRSATSQFFINLANNSRLDHRGFSPDDYGYAVFGRVISGMDVVDRIAAMPTGSREGMDDVPVTPVVIKSITAQQSVAK
jgi:cyclophilin family peptidyl-prolyl cis-trans isomerase